MYPGQRAELTPDKAAVIEAVSGRIVTYAELEARSVQFAHWLRAQGLKTGDHIAVLSVNDATAYELYWGAIRSGLYVTMVNTHLTAAEVAYIVDDCDAEVLVVSAPLADLAVDIVASTPKVRHRLAFGGDVRGYDDYELAIASMPTEPPADQPRGTDMLYSSGTTGRPKGIAPRLSGQQIGDGTGLDATAMMRDMGFHENAAFLVAGPVYHAAPLRFAVSTQALGGTVILMDRFDAEGSLAAIEKFAVTHSLWVPTHFVRMLKLPDEVRSRYDLSTMEVAVHAAAPCPADVKRAMMAWWGEVLWEYYASTESVGRTVISPQEWLRKPGSVGRGTSNSVWTVHICGPDGNDVPTGETGLVYFERPGYTFEYHGAPDKTADVRHPAHDDWATTGDIGYLDEDGYLFLTDREKFTIISGGVNIYPQEIEDRLTMHPAIFDVAVVGVPDVDMGQSVRAVVQLMPGVDGDDALSNEIVEFCRAGIARYKCPRSVQFVTELPRTPTGKVVKGDLVQSITGNRG